MNCALCFMFIRFRRFLVSTWPGFAGFGVVSTAIHGANAWWVLEHDFYVPLRSHINAIFKDGLRPLVQAYTFDCGEVNEQTQMRSVFTHTQVCYDLISNLPKLSRCYGLLHGPLATSSHGNEDQAETEDPADVSGEPLAKGRWSSRPRTSVTGDQNLPRTIVASHHI